MTPADLARLHAAAFERQRPWSEGEFAGLLDDPAVIAHGDARGFGLVRVAAGEAELLTLAVPPALRRQGNGRRILAALAERAAAAGATRLLLEVAAGNAAARALYAAEGWAEIARRPDYYRYPTGGTEDAVVLERALPAMPGNCASAPGAGGCGRETG